jgi:predicted dehydrogenase
MQGYPHEMQDFASAVAGGRPPLAGAQLGRDVVEIVYAAYQSAEEGRRVDLR